MPISFTPWGRDEPYPEMIPAPTAKVSADRTLTAREAALLAGRRDEALRRVLRATRKLARLGERLALAALATSEPMPTAGTAHPPPSQTGPVHPEPGHRPDPYTAGLSLPGWLTVGVLVVVAIVEYLFWLTAARQSVAYGDYTSPLALQAFALALLFPVVVIAGAMLGAAVGRLPVLPVGVRRGWYKARAAIGVVVVVAMSAAIALTAWTRFTVENAGVGARPLPVGPLALAFFLVPLVALAVHAYAVHPDEQNRARAARVAQRGEADDRRRAFIPVAARREHLRAWLALEAEVNRLLAGYHRGVAAADVAILSRRAGHGLAGPFPALRGGGVAALPQSVRTAGPVTWLDVPTPPRVQAVLEPSLRLLEQHRPTGPLAATQRTLSRKGG